MSRRRHYNKMLENDENEWIVEMLNVYFLRPSPIKFNVFV